MFGLLNAGFKSLKIKFYFTEILCFFLIPLLCINWGPGMQLTTAGMPPSQVNVAFGLVNSRGQAARWISVPVQATEWMWKWFFWRSKYNLKKGMNQSMLFSSKQSPKNVRSLKHYKMSLWKIKVVKYMKWNLNFQRKLSKLFDVIKHTLIHLKVPLSFKHSLKIKIQKVKMFCIFN